MPRSRGFGGDSRSRGRGFESHHPLLDGHIVRFKKKLKLTKKRTGIVHFKMPQMRKITIIDRRIQISWERICGVFFCSCCWRNGSVRHRRWTEKWRLQKLEPMSSTKFWVALVQYQLLTIIITLYWNKALRLAITSPMAISTHQSAFFRQSVANLQ